MAQVRLDGWSKCCKSIGSTGRWMMDQWHFLFCFASGEKGEIIPKGKKLQMHQQQQEKTRRGGDRVGSGHFSRAMCL